VEDIRLDTSIFKTAEYLILERGYATAEGLLLNLLKFNYYVLLVINGADYQFFIRASSTYEPLIRNRFDRDYPALMYKALP
jgi:hypothetical protein